ncbi:hypothetical protein ACET3Z_026302 [Daucus carota]
MPIILSSGWIFNNILFVVWYQRVMKTLAAGIDIIISSWKFFDLASKQDTKLLDLTVIIILAPTASFPHLAAEDRAATYGADSYLTKTKDVFSSIVEKGYVLGKALAVRTSDKVQKVDQNYQVSQKIKSAVAKSVVFSNKWVEWDAVKSDDVHWWGLKSSEKILSQLEDVGQQLALTFDNEGSVLAVGGEDLSICSGGSITKWNTTLWSRISSKHITRDSVTAFNFYILPSMQLHTAVKKAHLGIVTYLMFSHDSRALLSTSSDSSARVTLVEDKKERGVGVVALDVPDRVNGRDVETTIEEVRALRMGSGRESGRERKAAENERKAAEEEGKAVTEARKAAEESRAKAARWW